MTPNSLKTTPKSKEKEGKRGEKKRTPGTCDYYIVNFGKKKGKKSLATHQADALAEEYHFQKSGYI